MNEAYKLIVFPHGKVEVKPGKFAFKYLIGGVILSEQEIKMDSETIIMDSGGEELSKILSKGKKYTWTNGRLGSLEKGMYMLGCLHPEHEHVDPQ